MSRQRDLLVNFERMRREMDELFGDVWDRTRVAPRREPGFSPRVDVYYCGSPPKAVVKAEIPGVDLEDVTLEVRGRMLTISGERSVSDTEGRAYQQVEIAAGRFRREIQLSAEVEAGGAAATLEDGVLRVELPLRNARRGRAAGTDRARRIAGLGSTGRRAADRGRRAPGRRGGGRSSTPRARFPTRCRFCRCVRWSPTPAP